MKHLIFGLIAATCLAACDPAPEGYAPAFDTSQFKGPQNKTQNQILVLGTPHLSQLPDDFKSEALSSTLTRLEAWQPQIITIEAVSGPQCEYMRAYPARYKDSVEFYCWDSAPARKATGLTVAQATEAAQRQLANWPENPTAAQRRNLASLFLAGGDRSSALVQWLRLPQGERRAGDGIDDALRDLLNAATVKRNENYQIAATLAARLGLERVYPVDDHTAGFSVDDEDAYGAAIQKAWDNPASQKRMKISDELNTQLTTPDGVLNLYRVYNSPEMGPLAFQSDFGAALEEPSMQNFGRSYVTYWEVRNLRMAANIRETLGPKPGLKTLVIVGASHKPYLESYLHQMHDVRIIDAEKVLE